MRWCPLRRRWVAEVWDGASTQELGLYLRELDAARAYDLAIIELLGERAGLGGVGLGLGLGLGLTKAEESMAGWLAGWLAS